MNAPKRRAPSRLMAAMANRVGETRSNLLTAESTFAHSFEVDVTLVDPDQGQARKVFDDEAIASLAESFKAQGQLQPILVRHHPDKRGHWLIVAGERRWQAARKLEWSVILAIEYTGEHEVASLVENLQRVDLNVLEEANAIQRLIQLNGWSQRTAAQVLGRSASDVNGLLKLLELPSDFLERVLKSEHPLSRNLLIELSRLPPGSLQDDLLTRAKAADLTIPDVRRAISESRAKTSDAAFVETSPNRIPSPGLGGKRRLDSKAIKRFHNAFVSAEVDTFSAEDRTALILFAEAVQKAFGVTS